MNLVELHRLNSRSWYSVGAAVRPEDDLRFVRERVAVGDDTAQMMGGSADRHLQMRGRWFDVHRFGRYGLPKGLSREARLRLWRSPVMQENHARFVEMVDAHFAPALRDEFERRNARSPEYKYFMERWRRGLRQTLAEFAWTRTKRGEVRTYLIGSAVIAARREHRQREKEKREAAERTLPLDADDGRSLHDEVPSVDDPIGRDDLEHFLAVVRTIEAQDPLEAKIYRRLIAWGEEHRGPVTVQDAVDELHRLLSGSSDPGLYEAVAGRLSDAIKTA